MCFPYVPLLLTSACYHCKRHINNLPCAVGFDGTCCQLSIKGNWEHMFCFKNSLTIWTGCVGPDCLALSHSHTARPAWDNHCGMMVCEAHFMILDLTGRVIGSTAIWPVLQRSRDAAHIENLLTVLIYIHPITHSGENGSELAGGLSDTKGTRQMDCLLLAHTRILKIWQNIHISGIWSF